MKTQMKFQKILSLVTLIAAALSAVLALSFCTGILSEIKVYTTKYSGELYGSANPIGADALFEYTQAQNDVFVIMAIVMIVVAAVIYITSTNKRRNYYVTNYVAIGLVVAYTAAFAIYLVVMCSKALSLAGDVNFARWQELVNTTKTDRFGNVIYLYPQNYSENKGTMALGIVLAVVLLAVVAAWVLDLIWKIKLMQGEKALLANGVEVKTMEVA